MLGSKKEKGNQLPSEENLNQKGANMKLIDSESDANAAAFEAHEYDVVKWIVFHVYLIYLFFA